jgi:hypothetical protein
MHYLRPTELSYSLPMSDTLATWEQMTADLAKALQDSGGDPQRERASIARALASYGRARAAAIEPPFEHAIHFFAVDGVALDFRVKPAFMRVLPDEATEARWLSILETLPRRLDLLDALAVKVPAA